MRLDYTKLPPYQIAACCVVGGAATALTCLAIASGQAMWAAIDGFIVGTMLSLIVIQFLLMSMDKTHKVMRGLVEALEHARGDAEARVVVRDARTGETVFDSDVKRLVKCPHCEGTEFRKGPRALDINLNVFCAQCGAGFNTLDAPGGPFLLHEINPPTWRKN